MSKDEKRTQRSSGGFEDKIDAAMADLEVNSEDEFHDADFFEEEDTQSFEEFDSWDDTEDAHDQDNFTEDDSIEEDDSTEDDFIEEDYPEEYPEEEEYDDQASAEYGEDNEGDSRELPDEQNTIHEDSEEEVESQSEDLPPHSRKSRSRQGNKKSARPARIAYVPISEEELDEKVIPVQKKKHKGLKVTGLVMAIMAMTAGCAYGAVTYYYADRFFEGTYINGVNCSNKTAYEAEQIIADKVEDYSIEISSRNQEPQSISGSQIGYQYISDGEVLALL